MDWRWGFSAPRLSMDARVKPANDEWNQDVEIVVAFLLTSVTVSDTKSATQISLTKDAAGR